MRTRLLRGKAIVSMLMFALCFLLAGAIGVFAPKERAQKASAATTAKIKANETLIYFVNNTSFMNDAYRLPTKETLTGGTSDDTYVTGKWEYIEKVTNYSSSDPWYVNKKLTGLTSMNAPLLHFKNTSIDTSTSNKDTKHFRWESQNATSSLKGPYEIQSLVSVISFNGKLYMPYFILGVDAMSMFNEIPFGAALLEVTNGKTVGIKDLCKNIKEYLITYLPLGNCIFTDDVGIYILSGHDDTTKYYFTLKNGKPSLTSSASDSDIVKPETTVPQAEVTDKISPWENNQYNPHGTYDGTSNGCPVADSEYWTVTPKEGNNAGRYTALVTPKDGYAWEDGSTEFACNYGWRRGEVRRRADAATQRREGRRRSHLVDYGRRRICPNRPRDGGAYHYQSGWHRHGTGGGRREYKL